MRRDWVVDGWMWLKLVVVVGMFDSQGEEVGSHLAYCECDTATRQGRETGVIQMRPNKLVEDAGNR